MLWNGNDRSGLATYSVSHYDVLGVKPSASQLQIKSAYYKLSKKYHPDVAVDVDNAKEKFAQLSASYEVLSNPDKRATYDRTLHPGMGVHTTFSPDSGIDVEYREFLRRRGSFRPRTTGYPRTTGQATSGTSRTSTGARFNYEELLRQQHYERLIRQRWARQRNYGVRMQNEYTGLKALSLFFMLTALFMLITPRE